MRSLIFSFLKSSTSLLMLASLVLAVLNFNIDTAFGDARELADPVLFGGGDVLTPFGTVESWHDRGAWNANTAFTCGANPDDEPCENGLIPGLPTNYNPDYAAEGLAGLDASLAPNPLFPTTPLNVNDPFDASKSVAFNNANALGPNAEQFLAVPAVGAVPQGGLNPGDILFFHNGVIGVNANDDQGNPVPVEQRIKIVDVNHNVYMGVRSDSTFGGSNARTTSFHLGATNDSGQAILNIKGGDFFKGDGMFRIGSEVSGSDVTLNFTSGGLVQVGNSLPANIPGEPTNTDAAMIIGSTQGNSTGTFNQTGGEVVVSGQIAFGPGNPSTGGGGTYNMNSGIMRVETLDAAPGAAEVANIQMGQGDDKFGVFNQTGGTVSVDAEIVLGVFSGEQGIFSNSAQGQGTWNISASAGGSATGDFDGDGDVDGGDFLLWQRGGSPNGIGSGDLADWETNYGSTGGGSGGTATLNQGVGTSNGGADRGALVVGRGGTGVLNIDGSAGAVEVNAASIVLAELGLIDNSIANGDSSGLLKITGDNATVTTGNLMVGEGDATVEFDFNGASTVSSIDVTGDVDLAGTGTSPDTVLELNLAGVASLPGGSVVLIDIGGALTGTFATVNGLPAGFAIDYSSGDVVLTGPAALAAVPEPTTAAMCLLAMLGAMTRRNRNR